MKRGIAFAVVALCAIAGTPSLSWAAEPSPKPALAPAVTVTRAVEREVIERAIVTGTLVPREEILVAPEIEGLRITEVLVEEGDVVEKGEVLARLSRDLLEAQLAQNQAAIARAEAAISQAGSNIIQAEAAQLEAAAGARAGPLAHEGRQRYRGRAGAAHIRGPRRGGEARGSARCAPDGARGTALG